MLAEFVATIVSEPVLDDEEVVKVDDAAVVALSELTFLSSGSSLGEVLRENVAVCSTSVFSTSIFGFPMMISKDLFRMESRTAKEFGERGL